MSNRQLPPSDPSEAVIVPPSEAAAVDLSAAAQIINATIDGITGHEEAFEEATLEPRLTIGLEILRAQEVFGMTRADAGDLGGRPSETLSRRDTVFAAMPNFLGFSNWIAREIPRLKRPTAIKYATAFKSLDLDSATATPQQIRERVKKLRHDAGKQNLPMPTLGSLYRAGKPPKDEPVKMLPSPLDSPTQRLRDAREFWHLFESKGRQLVTIGCLDDLDKQGLETLKEFNLWLRDRINARIKDL
jgi:hypothetical protein